MSDEPVTESRRRVRVAVFAIGVALVPIGAGMLFVPQQPCTAEERASKPPAACSTHDIRRDGAILGAIGLAGVWFGRMSIAARRKTSAWDRSWR